MNWFFGDFITDASAAWHGPLSFRLVLQPLVAAALGIRAGMRDAKLGRPPFLAQLLGSHATRSELLQEARGDIGRLFLIALVADLLFQLIANHRIHPGQGLIAAILLAVPAYVLTRGATGRFAPRP